MVLVNTLTVEAINTALIALQRGQSIVVGGEKGTTVNNITITNSGSGGGSGGSSSSLDFTPQVNALDQRVGLLEKAEELLRQEDEKQNERIAALEELGIDYLDFDPDSRTLTITLKNEETFETTIPSDSFEMNLDNGELVLKIGDNEQRLPLPEGHQSDWTETDPDDPSFIRNKIPIWVTNGQASDNMQPIDSVKSGEMRPVTSNAVAQKGYLTSADITDQVTVDNMQSVSSNAVARELATSNDEIINGSYRLTYYKWGKVVLAEAYASITLSGNDNVYFPFLLPEGIRPAYQVRVALINNSIDSLCGQACFYTNGEIALWHQQNGGTDANFRATFCYITP